MELDELDGAAELKSIFPIFPLVPIVMNGIGAAASYFLEKKEGITFPEPGDLKLLMMAVMGYVVATYFLMFRQGISCNIVNKDLRKSEKPEHVAYFANACRSFEREVEQMPMVMTAVVFYGVLVNPIRAGYLCLSYTLLLILYPLLHPDVLPSTIPRYVIVLYMVWGVFWTAVFHN